MADNRFAQGEETLGDDVRMMLGGMATLVLLIVPVLLIRKIVRTVEEGNAFQALERTLS